MKIPYGEFVWPPHVKEMEGVPLLTAHRRMMEYLRANAPDMSNAEMIEEASIQVGGAQLLIDGKSQRCVHYYFTGDGMHDWLKQCATPLVDEHIASLKSFSETSGPSIVLMLHFRGGATPVYLCGLYNEGAMVKNGKWQIKATWTFMCSKGKQSPIYYISGERDGFDFQKQDEDYRETIGTIASAISYMACFPETVVDGVPGDIANPNHSKGLNAKSVGVSESIMSHDSPTPHFRVGHFRFLKSERFTHKRGMSVFVKGCFVKGQAKTVLSPEDVHTQNK